MNSGKKEPIIVPMESNANLNIAICFHEYVYDLKNFILKEKEIKYP